MGLADRDYMKKDYHNKKFKKIGLDVHKKLSYYSMVDSKGTEVKKGRFPTACEGLDEFGSVVPEGVGMAIEASTSGIFVYEYLDGLLTGELCPGERDEGS